MKYFSFKKVSKLVSKEAEPIKKLLKWLKMFSGSNRNLGTGYKPDERRGGVVVDFSFLRGEIAEKRSNSKVKDETLKDKTNIGLKKPSVEYKMDSDSVKKLAHFDLLKSERDFYYSKLRDIDHLLDVCKDASAETLAQSIRELLYLPPEKIAMVSEEGKILIKTKENATFNKNQNINANFTGGESVGADFDFQNPDDLIKE